MILEFWVPRCSDSSTFRKVGLSQQRGAHFEPDCSKSVLRGVTFVIGVAQSRPRGQNPRGKLGVPKCDTFINFYGCRSRRAAEDRLCPELAPGCSERPTLVKVELSLQRGTQNSATPRDDTLWYGGGVDALLMVRQAEISTPLKRNPCFRPPTKFTVPKVVDPPWLNPGFFLQGSRRKHSPHSRGRGWGGLGWPGLFANLEAEGPNVSYCLQI